jgi:MFS family permease
VGNDEGGRPRNPWWIPPFLGRVPVGVEQRHLTLLGFVALAMFFENYDLSLLTSVLKFLSEDFGLSEAELGTFAGSIRLGTLPAFFLVPLADRIGRQRMFLVSVAGLSIGAFLTAFSQTPMQFVALQVLSRSFIITASATAFVIVTEEFPAEHRGWGIGMLGAVASIGFGAGALVFGLIHQIPFGWRGLYALGIVPVFLLPTLRRGIPETRRFRARRGEALARRGMWSAIAGGLRPIAELAREHPAYALAVIVLGTLATAGHATAFQLTAYYVLGVHGWAPWQYSIMFFFCGAVGIVGSPLAGRLGDLYGRRTIGRVVLGLFPLAAFTFYTGPGWAVPIGWVAMVFLSMSSSVVIRALTNEVFPTSHRGTGGGLLSSVETIGAAGGLFLYALLQGIYEHQGLVVGAISMLTVVSAAALFLFPETRARELEAISGEAVPPDEVSVS